MPRYKILPSVKAGACRNAEQTVSLKSLNVGVLVVMGAWACQLVPLSTTALASTLGLFHVPHSKRYQAGTPVPAWKKSSALTGNPAQPNLGTGIGANELSM